MIKTLLVFRHGETDWNAEERFQGHIDIPLNSRGKEQARNLIPLLNTHSVEAILSSDLSRAFETASLIADELKVPVFKDSRLRESHLGDAQGLTRREIEARFGAEVVERWRSPHLSDADVSYPGGETGTAVYSRVSEALIHFMESFHYSRFGVATHGGVIRRLMQNILPPGSPQVPIPNGVLYSLEFDLVIKKFKVK